MSFIDPSRWKLWRPTRTSGHRWRNCWWLHENRSFSPPIVERFQKKRWMHQSVRKSSLISLLCMVLNASVFDYSQDTIETLFRLILAVKWLKFHLIASRCSTHYIIRPNRRMDRMKIWYKKRISFYWTTSCKCRRCSTQGYLDRYDRSNEFFREQSPNPRELCVTRKVFMQDQPSFYLEFRPASFLTIDFECQK